MNLDVYFFYVKCKIHPGKKNINVIEMVFIGEIYKGYG